MIRNHDIPIVVLFFIITFLGIMIAQLMVPFWKCPLPTCQLPLVTLETRPRKNGHAGETYASQCYYVLAMYLSRKQRQTGLVDHWVGLYDHDRETSAERFGFIFYARVFICAHMCIRNHSCMMLAPIRFTYISYHPVCHIGFGPLALRSQIGSGSLFLRQTRLSFCEWGPAAAVFRKGGFQVYQSGSRWLCHEQLPKIS